MVRGTKLGIPTIEVYIGDYLEDWEIDDKWKTVQQEMKKLREEGIKVVEDKRDERGRFRSYVVLGDDVTKGRL